MNSYKRRIYDAVRCNGLGVVAGVLVAGCASTMGSSYSTRVAPAKAGDISGIPYSLPRAMLTATLIRDTEGIALEIGEPVLSGDPQATYLLQYRQSSTSKDSFRVGVDSQTALLKSVGAEGEDQTAQAIVAVVKAVSGVAKRESSVSSPQRMILYQRVFDPSEDTQVQRINSDLKALLSNQALAMIREECNASRRAAALTATQPPQNRRNTAPDPAPDQSPARCALADHWPATTAPALNVVYSPFKFTNATAASCEIGICTRATLPALLSIESAGLPLISQQFNIPNNSDPIPVDLSRATFVKATHSVTLRNGLIESTERSKESQALAVANIPFDILKAVFAAPAELIQLKINLTTNEKELVNAQKEKLEAEKARLEAEEQLEEAKQQAANDGGDATPDATKDDSAAVAGGKESDLQAPANTAAKANGVLMRIVLPGLGRGSGAELAPVGLADLPDAPPAQVAAAETTPKTNKNTDANAVLGGPVAGGSDGTKKQ